MQYLKYAVSTYLYVPKKYDRLQNTPTDVAGSHEDLFPTLYELALSQASYYNFGIPIMYKKRENAFGWNLQNRFIFAEGVVTSNKKMHTWDKSTEERRYVDVNTTALSTKQVGRIERNRYQRLLKKYLLIKEYEDER